MTAITPGDEPLRRDRHPTFITRVVAPRLARDVWLRRPQRALALLGARQRLDAESLALLSWLTLVVDGDEKAAARMAEDALRRSGDTRFASATLAEVLLRAQQYDEALAVVAAARRRFPDIPWYELTLADTLIDAARLTEAEVVLERATADPSLRRHALKRLSRLALNRGDRARARHFLERLVAMAPNYLVYASDYVSLGTLQLESGDRQSAAATWRRGATTYPRNQALGQLLIERIGEHPPAGTPRIRALDEEALGIRRIAVKTRLITPRTGVLSVLNDAISSRLQPGDVIAVSESAAAIGQGRVLPVELIRPGLLATALCRFVAEWGPLHSPEGMQGAVMDAGRLRVCLGAAAGAVGKAVGHRGWFYRVVGRRTAMIDDVAGCLPPYDHHVIFGPAEPEALCRELAVAVGCPVAIVDANHFSGAWVVGASAGIDRVWLAQALADNPAGNEDEQTPVIIVRRITN